MSMKNPNDSIGNRTRNSPACSAVPRTIALPRDPISRIFPTQKQKWRPVKYLNQEKGFYRWRSLKITVLEEQDPFQSHPRQILVPCARVGPARRVPQRSYLHRWMWCNKTVSLLPTNWDQIMKLCNHSVRFRESMLIRIFDTTVTVYCRCWPRQAVYGRV